MIGTLDDVNSVLENQDLVYDLSRVVGSLDMPEGFQGGRVEKAESLDRPKLEGKIPKLIGSGFEQLAAWNYGAEFKDNSADVYIGFDDDFSGWGVQVKSCSLFVNNGGLGQRGSFVVRHESYDDLPPKSLFELNLYSVVDEPVPNGRTTLGFNPEEYEGIDDFEEAKRQTQIFEPAVDGSPGDDLIYLDLHRQVLIPKNLFEEVVRRYDDSDLSIDPDEEDAPWYPRKEYNVPWKKIFGEQGTPIENSPLQKTARDIYHQQENHRVTGYTVNQEV
ncbi:hypothetical protein [Candidatus Nanohalobium constans]|uniref:Restriction endonuclease n=1 Tax=Candidatus Nanohalobium constans TaxID=2565781 RepID=A0A5Q0UFB4_9ARCH|nr:hypothetical protein [Candidatus Nanohalobium constans]QGA80292.1 hypothetical protein LC1Nh_0391 [Candidatus Nanohalobium constans]